MNDRGALAASFVERKIHELTESRNEAAARAMLARLRRGIGHSPGSIPELWEATLAGLPEEMLGQNGPSRGEWAVHTALTLFALHQQGKELGRQCMNREGQSLGRAIRALVHNSEDEPRIKRRFDAAATAGSMEEIAHHLRGLVTLLKTEDIALDYPALARELYWFQFPNTRDNVRLRWGQDFYRISRDRNNNENAEQERMEEV